MLSLSDEFQVLEAAYRAGVKVPRPVADLGDLDGRDAFAMELVEGETIGRRIVKEPPPGLDLELAEQLALIHAIPPESVPALQRFDPVDELRGELASLVDPAPAIEYGIWWLAEHRLEPLAPVVAHGDYRVGNIVVSPHGLEAVLDWEYAHVADPREDLGWSFVRAWRFGRDDLRLGGIAGPEAYVERYCELSGQSIPLDDLDWWEIHGNVRWAIGTRTQAQRHLSGEERNVELAVLGRLSAEIEYEVLDLIDRAGR
jgi:aminoglycoside phosphotransferase (APT) family kinase protein